MIRNPAANPGGDGARDPWRRQDGRSIGPSPWIVAPPSRISTGPSRISTGPSRISTGPSRESTCPLRVGTGLFPLATDPRRPAPSPASKASRNVPGYEFEDRIPRPGRHRNGRGGSVRRGRGPARLPAPGGRSAGQKRARRARPGFGRPGPRFNRRGQTVRVAVPVIVIALGIAVSVIVSANNRGPSRPPPLPVSRPRSWPGRTSPLTRRKVPAVSPCRRAGQRAPVPRS